MTPKSFRLLLSCSAVALLGASSAQAVTLAYDPFAYTNGAALTGLTGGIGFSGAYTVSGSSTVVGTPGLTYTDSNGAVLPTSGLSDSVNATGNFRGLSNAPSTVGTTLYVSFLANFGGSTAGYGGISLFQTTANENLFLGKPTASTTFGIDPKGGGTAVNSTFSAATTSLLVYRIDFTSAALTTIRLFVNPILGVEPATPSITTSRPSNFAFDTIRLQSGNGTTANFDEFRIGTTYADVAPVPEPSSCLLALGSTCLVGFVRRRRS